MSLERCLLGIETEVSPLREEGEEGEKGDEEDSMGEEGEGIKGLMSSPNEDSWFRSVTPQATSSTMDMSHRCVMSRSRQPRRMREAWGDILIGSVYGPIFGEMSERRGGERERDGRTTNDSPNQPWLERIVPGEFTR